MAQVIEASRIPSDPERGADPFPYQIAAPAAVRRRRFRLFALAGLAAYALTLIATLPARLLLERSGEPSIFLAVSGTMWSGEAALGQGHAIRWAWAPLASIANLRYTTHLEVSGPDTELKGMAAWRPSGITITDVDGNASASLITALAPSLPFVCDFPMRVNIERLAFGGTEPGAAGEVRASGGSCTGRGALVVASAPVPPLIAEASINVGGSTGWVAPQGNRADKLVTFAVTPNGETSVSVMPGASAMIPGIEVLRTMAQ